VRGVGVAPGEQHLAHGEQRLGQAHRTHAAVDQEHLRPQSVRRHRLSGVLQGFGLLGADVHAHHEVVALQEVEVQLLEVAWRRRLRLHLHAPAQVLVDLIGVELQPV